MVDDAGMKQAKAEDWEAEQSWQDKAGSSELERWQAGKQAGR